MHPDLRKALIAGLVSVVMIAASAAVLVRDYRTKTTQASTVTTEEALTGPSCTPVYPRGFTFNTERRLVIEQTAKRRKPKVALKYLPPQTCTGGELQATWRSCVQRYNL